ncbi:cobalt ECF transporter T component CbiQ [Lachnospiraceae bacterium 62-35]
MIDRYACSSPLRDCNPCKKAAWSAFFLITVIGIHSFWYSIAITVIMGIAAVGKGNVPWKIYRRLLLTPAAFLILGTTAMIWNISAAPMDFFALRIGMSYLTCSRRGLTEGCRLAASAMGAVSSLYFFALTTPMTDIFYVLQRIRCPDLLIELMLLIHRFIFVLLDTAQELDRAGKSRLGNRNMRTSIRFSANTVSMLFIRAVKRSYALYDAMEARGYDGKIRVLHTWERKREKTKNKDSDVK